MVLAERNSELVRNGRRSRGPSPNGHTGSGGGGVTVVVAPGGGVGPGGAATPDTSSDDDNSIKRNGKTKTKHSEYEEKIRVGRDYQAICPPLVPELERKVEVLNDRALLVWSPTKEIPDAKLEEYISVAKEKYGYNGEQALGMLFWHKHDLERAVMDLANFTPFPDEWTVEDKVLFEQAFHFHGKSFHRIRQMLPDKSIASLVKYYYSWKKTRHRQSVMDRQEKNKASKEGSENGSDNGSNEDSDNEDNKEQVPAAANASGIQDPTISKSANADGVVESTVKPCKSGDVVTAEADSESTASGVTNAAIKRQETPPNSITDSSCTGDRSTPTNNGESVSGGGGGTCANCGVVCNVLVNAVPHGKFCASCHHHWRRTGSKRPTSGPNCGKRSRDRHVDHKRKPPRRIVMNHDDIVSLASANDNQDDLLANIDREIVTVLTQVQTVKQNISVLKRKAAEGIDDVQPPELNNRINSRWTNEELLLAAECMRKHGKDFQTIAEVMGTKTEAHVRTFYVTNRRRYNLDAKIKEYEAEKEAAAAAVAAAASSAAASTSTEPTKKEEIKKKEGAATSTVVDESDNTTSSEMTASKSITNDDVKSCSSISTTQKENVIEIDLEVLEPPAKKVALSASNVETPRASVA